MRKYNFRWRNKAMIVLDFKDPIKKVDIEAKDLGEAWKIFYKEHLDSKDISEVHEIHVTQFR